MSKIEKEKIYKVVIDDDGSHKLGGRKPDEFSFPENKCLLPFEYVGYLNNEDLLFKWLPFKLHLACPIYLSFYQLFLDYSNPMCPVLINREVIEKATTVYDDLINSTDDEPLEEMTISFVESEDVGDFGYTGTPQWIQGEDIPICPKSGNPMKFVLQQSWWADGALYFFMEPNHKTVCCMLQFD